MTTSNETNKARILVVDDMATNRALIKQVLQGDKYSVTESVQGLDALEKIKTKGFDVVLMDIMMPKLDGFGVLKQIREDPDFRLLPIIILTTLGAPEEIARGLELVVLYYNDLIIISLYTCYKSEG